MEGDIHKESPNAKWIIKKQHQCRSSESFSIKKNFHSLSENLPILQLSFYLKEDIQLLKQIDIGHKIGCHQDFVIVYVGVGRKRAHV